MCSNHSEPGKDGVQIEERRYRLAFTLALVLVLLGGDLLREATEKITWIDRGLWGFAGLLLVMFAINCSREAWRELRELRAARLGRNRGSEEEQRKPNDSVT